MTFFLPFSQNEPLWIFSCNYIIINISNITRNYCNTCKLYCLRAVQNLNGISRNGIKEFCYSISRTKS